MNGHPYDESDQQAERATRVLRHLDGALDATMLEAMGGIWSTLANAATSGHAHARAVRERMFWESMAPGQTAAAHPIGLDAGAHGVSGLAPSWDAVPTNSEFTGRGWWTDVA